MTENELMTKFLSDLMFLRLPADEVDFKVRPYSKTFYGRYFPSCIDSVRARMFIYPYASDGSFMDYDVILETGIHEMCHHLQFTNPNFREKKGVMHDPDFWKLYNHYVCKAISLGMLGEDVNEKKKSAV